MAPSIPAPVLDWRSCARESSGWAEKWEWTPSRGKGAASGSSCQRPQRFQISPQLELGALAQKPRRVLEHQLFDRLNRVTASLHFQRSPGHRQWIADTPIAGAVHPKPLTAVHLDHINGSCRRAFGFGIKCHSRPHPGVEHQLYGVLLDVIDDDPVGMDAFIILEHVHDKARTL